MRIVSLLPALTEMVAALGRAEFLVGVTHECDYPPEIAHLPRLTFSRLSPLSTSAEIDQMVSEQRAGLYELDDGLLRELAPDLILTQKHCDVCAVSERDVRQAAQQLPGTPHVESVNPITLSAVHDVILLLGRLLGAEAEAERLLRSYEETAEEIASRTGSELPRQTVVLEWMDPLYTSGHWIPEVIEHANGADLLARPGEASRRVSWETLTEADPESILLAPCGFSLEQGLREYPRLLANPAWQALRAVREKRAALCDGNAYFSRPGPRLEHTLRIAAAVLHPESCGDLAPEGDGWVWLHNAVVQDSPMNGSR